MRDPGGPGGLRFAVPGVDVPSDCVADASGLPDAEITLRAFRDRAEAGPYLAALAEHGGNAFSWLASPFSHRGPAFALVFRADRPRLPGTSLDEAIVLRGPADGLAEGWAGHRTGAAAEAALEAGRASLAARWGHLERDVRAMPGAMVTAVREDGVAFLAPGSQAAFVIGDGVVRCEDRSGDLPQDLDRAHRRRLSRAGAAQDAPGRWSMPVRGRPVGEVLAEAAGLAADRAVLAAVAARRRRLESLRRDRACMAVLARGAAGHPLLVLRGGMQAVQGDGSGGTTSVPGHVLSRLSGLDMLRPAWVPGPGDARPALLVPTPAAAALARGDVARAADLAGGPAPGPCDGFAEAVGEMAAGLPPEALEALASAVPAPPADGEELADARTAGAWASAVAALAAGSRRSTRKGGCVRPGRRPRPGPEGRAQKRGAGPSSSASAGRGSALARSSSALWRA